MMLFGEKYGDEVRVLDRHQPRAVRRHRTSRTGDIGLFRMSSPRAASPPACAVSRR